MLFFPLTLVQLNPDMPCPALQTVDPDQLASEEANWSGSALFAIQYFCFCINNMGHVIVLAEN